MVKSINYEFRHFSKFPVTFFLLVPNLLLSSLYSDTLNLCSSVHVGGRASFYILIMNYQTSEKQP
jgi:hypothetical protein